MSVIPSPLLSEYLRFAKDAFQNPPGFQECCKLVEAFPNQGETAGMLPAYVYQRAEEFWREERQAYVDGLQPSMAPKPQNRHLHQRYVSEEDDTDYWDTLPTKSERRQHASGGFEKLNGGRKASEQFLKCSEYDSEEYDSEEYDSNDI